MAFSHILILGILHATAVSAIVEEELSLLCNSSVILPLENIETRDDGSIYDPKTEAIYPKGTYQRDEEHDIVYGCPCDLDRPCLWKCCPHDQAIQSTSNNCTAHSSDANWFQPVVNSDDGKWNRSVTGHEDFVVFYRECGEGMSMIPEVEYILRGADGSMVLHRSGEPLQMSPDTFCIDYAVGLERYVAYHCFNHSGINKESDSLTSICKSIIYIIYPIGVLISIIFLIITLFVYTCLPEVRNLHGKCALCYVSSLLTGYVFLAVVQIGGFYISDDICHVAGFIIYFAFLSTFSWLNVICIDIAIAFSGFRGMRETNQESDGRKFLYYVTYAWGLPLLLLGMSLYLEFGDVPSNLIKPMLRRDCWFGTDDSRLVYYNLPVVTITIVNMVLFIFTAVKIFQLKKQTKVLMTGGRRHSENGENRQRFTLYLKLFIVMGVNWAVIHGHEFIYLRFHGSDCIWIPVDIFHTLQGFFISLIFVCKAKIRRKLIERLCPRFASTMKKEIKPGSSSSKG